MSTRSPEEDDIVGEWRKEKVLGSGGFGMVILWKNLRTNKCIALKQVRWANDPMLTPKHKQRWTQEVDIMKRLSHPNVVSAVAVPDVLNVGIDELPLLAMEYCTGGDLRKVLSKPENCCGLTEYEVRTILRHVSSALRHLHNLRIIHRDMKPENIVLQEMDGRIVYKLIDLGYAKELDQNSLCTSFVGTLQYLAPELFMSQKYTSTVDYWSFGLVAHECITGVRPFVPTWSPAQWIGHVMKKDPEHICAYLEPDGAVVFSSELFPENHISRSFKKLVEGWLAVMLEFDPQNRGCILTSGEKEIIAYSMLDSVLNKKIITVFHVNSCQYFYYEVGENTTMGHVVHWITTDLNLPKNDFLFLLQHGNPLDLKKGALHYCAEPEDEEWVMYMYDKDISKLPHVAPHIPPLVERMFREPNTTPGYNLFEEQKKMWAHSVFFISQERKTYRRLLQAQKIVMMHLLSRNSLVYNTTTKMTRELNRLKAKLELFETSLQCDIEKYEHQAHNGGITSNIMLTNWVRNQEISKKIAQLQEKVLGLESNATVVNTKTIELQRSPYARNKVPQILDEIYEKALKAYDMCKKRPKEDRHLPIDNGEMVNLVLSCIKNRERLLRDIYLHLQKLMSCIDDVQKLIGPMEKTLKDITDHDKQLECIQKERQTDIWKLVENLCKKIRAVKSSTFSISSTSNARLGETTVPNSLATSSSGSASNSYVSLSSILTKSSQDTPSILHENSQMHSQLISAQQYLHKINSEVSSLHNSLDWNFLDSSKVDAANSSQQKKS